MTDTHALEPTNPSWQDLLRGPYGPSLALVSMAVWLHAADSLVVATMIPSIIADVGGANRVAWSVTLYLMASIVAGAASALITLRFGLRPSMSIAALIFGLGCLLSALAPSMPLVLAGRLFQGLGGGALVSMGFIATRILFPPRFLPKAMAVVSTLWGASAFLGPALGGGFVEYATWRWGFAAFGLQAFVLAIWIAMLPLNTDTVLTDQPTPIPWRRLVLLCAAVLLVAHASVEVEWPTTTVSLLLAMMCFAWFLRLDDRAGATRMLPRRPFDVRTRVGAALLMVLCFCLATVTNSVFGAVLLTRIHHASALTAGYVLASGAFGWTVAAFLVSGATERWDRRLIAAGMMLVTSSIIGFTLVYPMGPVGSIAAVGFLGGAGFGMAWTFVLRQATVHVSEAEAQRISSAISTVQRVGYALGAAYVGLIANALEFEQALSAAQAADIGVWVFASCLPVAAIGLIALYGFVRKNPS